MAVLVGSDITMKECGAPCTNGANSLRMTVSELDPLSVHGAPTSFVMKMHQPSLTAVVAHTLSHLFFAAQTPTEPVNTPTCQREDKGRHPTERKSSFVR